MDELTYTVEKYTRKTAGGRWTLESTENRHAVDYADLKRIYQNIMDDNDPFGGGRPRVENNYSRLGLMSAKSFYSPSGLEKSRWVF